MFDEDESAFHRAILDRPDESMNVLVYADWLEERGRDERAALMRAAPTMRVWMHDPTRPRVDIDAIDPWRYTLLPRESAPAGRYSHDSVACICEYQWVFERRRFWVRVDGTTSANGEWWGWLLALALAHGWRMPNPEPA